MRIDLDQGVCQGHGLCAMHASEVFDLDDIDGHSILRTPNVPASLEEAARRAAQSCPERAIRVVENDQLPVMGA